MSVEASQSPRYKVQDVLDAMYASLPALIARKAGYANEDLPNLIFRVAEVFGIMETASTLLGSECEKEVVEALMAYKRYFEEALTYLLTERYDKDRIEALTDKDLYNLGVYTMALIKACLRGGGNE